MHLVTRTFRIFSHPLRPQTANLGDAATILAPLCAPKPIAFTPSGPLACSYLFLLFRFTSLWALVHRLDLCTCSRPFVVCFFYLCFCDTYFACFLSLEFWSPLASTCLCFSVAFCFVCAGVLSFSLPRSHFRCPLLYCPPSSCPQNSWDYLQFRVL